MNQPPDNGAENRSVPPAADAIGADAAKHATAAVVFFLRRMGAQHVSSAAAALSFSTTLAVVPALALALAGLAGFPAFDRLRANIQNAIVNNLVPDLGLKVSDALGGFIQATGKLTAFGVVGLIATAILLLLTIEGQLNRIFHVIRPRPLSVRLLIFWAVMSVGPFLLGLGFSLFGYFSALQFLPKSQGGSFVAFALGEFLPTLLTWAVVAFIFLVLPNRRVKAVDALIGAGVAALLLAVLRYTFASFIALMTSYQAIYGALAAVPVFLAWLYLVWLSVMVGAVITSGLPDWRYTRESAAGAAPRQLLLGLEVLACLASTRRDGEGWTRQRLLPSVKVSDAKLSAVLELLRTGRFVAVTTDGHWVLSRDLERTPLADLIHYFGMGYDVDASIDSGDSELSRRLDAHLKNAAASERTLLSISLARLVAPPDDQVTA